MKKSESLSQIKYLTCGKKQHEEQYLNYICIQKNCKESGLVCSLCREEHKTHRIIPVKIVVDKIRSQFTSPFQSDHYCDQLQQLQNLKQSLLFKLKCCVQQVAEEFRVVQEDIINSHNKIKLQIIQQVELSMQLDDLLSSTINGKMNRQDYLWNMRKISKCINQQQKQINFKINFQKLVIPYRNQHQLLESQLIQIEKNIKHCFHKQKQSISHSLSINNLKEITKYRFSSTFKGSTIIINDNKTIATQQTTGASRFAIIEGGMGIKQRKIIFKIKKLVNWVGLGVCIKDKIIAVNYAFKYENLGHGSYLLSNNGYTWSHSSSQDNIHPCLFTFKQQNTIEVTLSPTQLSFKVRQTSATLKLKINYQQNQWPNVCFCANLCSQGDSVEILDE